MEARLSTNGKHTVLICCGSGCPGADQITARLQEEIKHLRLDVEVKSTGCHGFCQVGPTMILEPEDVFYCRVSLDDIPEIIEKHLINNQTVTRLLYTDPMTREAIPHYSDINFYKQQERVILRNCGEINPEKIEDYLASGGYKPLRKVIFDMKPEQVIEEVKKAGLRGRGGAGFPTATKWEFCRSAPGSPKYVICNADEGDPGAFMDRSILEANPHAVLEGLTIAAYAIGASQGYIYCRAEKPLAIARLKTALKQMPEHGLVGKNILGSSFSFQIEIREGAGAFVCGEETALIMSIEGKRGMPRPRPPFPAQQGLDGKPTVINNVKSLASIPIIIEKGADWFSKIGTEKSHGTAVFALTGKIANSGLVEVPMGTPLSRIIYDIGGGIPRGKRLKAVQTGGPAGGCIPARFIDTPVDFDRLASLGSIMGSGGMVVLDESTCMVDVAKFFLSFIQSESCGKCTPCRLGTRQMLEILNRITEGKGHDEDMDTLINIAKTVKECSLCGLGQNAPNPVLSTINYFRDEYDAHIKDKKCPAAVCDALMISPCQHTCPVGINIPKYVAHIAAGEYQEAIDTIRERNPFPAICGRICHHPCELRCRRGELDEPVSIRALKRYAADWYFGNGAKEPEPFPRSHTERVAVVGAGPTGLSCAYFLAKMGYGVTVFEALPIGGGMLSVAIPEFRLPAEVIQKEIDYIAKKGVEIRYNTPLNTNFTIEDLKKQGYNSIFIAAGAQRSQRIGIPGELEDVEGFYYGLRFLRDAKLGKPIKIGRRVVVVGAGNVALDVAMTAIRLGADKVECYELQAREQMLVTETEYKDAMDEGIQFHFLTSPTRIVNENWKVVGIHCIRRQLGQPDANGRRRSEPISGTEFFVEVDTVIVSVGQAPDLSFLPSDSALERTRWERLAVDDNRLATSVPGVFAGGDFVAGPGKIIEAIAAGRRAAIAIDKHLRGDTSRVITHDMKSSVAAETQPPKLAAETEEWEAQPRVPSPTLPMQQRKASFAEIELCLSPERAKEEAKRCLRCDLEKF